MAGSDSARFLSRPKGLAARWAVLTAVMLLGFAVGAGFGFSAYGPAGLFSAIVAAGVCWAAASAALCLSAFVSGPNAALASLALGMGIRMSVPLAVFMALRKVEVLASAGFVWQLAAFYLLMLAVETWLTLPDPAAARSRSALSALPPPAGASAASGMS